MRGTDDEDTDVGDNDAPDPDREDRDPPRAFQRLLFVLVVVSGLANVHMCIRTGGLQDRQSATARRLQGLERVEAHDVDILRTAVTRLSQHLPTEQDMLLCRRRTQCLRDTFETLINVWPGRARVPEPCGDWPNWPHPGAMLR
jgi:hypothetical protein